MARSQVLHFVSLGLLLLWTGVDAAGWVLPTPPTAPTTNVNSVFLNRVLDYMDTSVYPCDNFQKYAGGKYEDKHADDDYSEILGEVSEKMDDLYQTIFDSLQDQIYVDPNSVEAKVRQFYKTCRTATNDTRLSKRYLQLVQPDVQLTWPQFATSRSAWPKERFSWMRTLARLRRFGFVNLLFKVTADLDFVDSSKYMITIVRPTYDDTVDRLPNTASTKRILIRLGVAPSRALQLTKNIKRLEKALKNLVSGEDEPNDDLTLKELESQNGFGWQQYFQTIFDRSFPTSTNVQIMNVDYFVELKRLLRTYDADVIASYFMVRFARFMGSLTESGADNDVAECVKDTRTIFDFGSTFLYETRYFDVYKQQKYDSEVQKIFNEIRNTLLARISSNRLALTLRQRSFLRQKLESLTFNVGTLPKGQDHRNFVTMFYRNMKLDDDQDFAAAVLKVLETRNSRVLELLSGPAVKGANYYFLETPLPTTNAEPKYVRRENVIFVPYDILQEPYFSPDSHDVFKVSGFGFMIAQAIMTVIDADYLVYDFAGNPTDAFGQLADNKQYDQGIKCLDRNATDYMDQRVIDVTALKLIYDVYFAPGSKFNQQQPTFTTIPLQQLFFLNFAQNLIGDEEFITFEGQDSDQVRLHQALANLPGFAQAFNCPVSAKSLNPPIKCELW